MPQTIYRMDQTGRVLHNKELALEKTDLFCWVLLMMEVLVESEELAAVRDAFA